MPAHEHHRLVIIPGEPQLAALLAVRRVEHLVLGVGHLALRQVERFGDGNPVHGHFVEVAVAEAGGRQQRVEQRPVVSHEERTGIDAPQPHTRRSDHGKRSKVVYCRIWYHGAYGPILTNR